MPSGDTKPPAAALVEAALLALAVPLALLDSLLLALLALLDSLLLPALAELPEALALLELDSLDEALPELDSLDEALLVRLEAADSVALLLLADAAVKLKVPVATSWLCGGGGTVLDTLLPAAVPLTSPLKSVRPAAVLLLVRMAAAPVPVLPLELELPLEPELELAPVPELEPALEAEPVLMLPELLSVAAPTALDDETEAEPVVQLPPAELAAWKWMPAAKLAGGAVST